MRNNSSKSKTNGLIYIMKSITQHKRSDFPLSSISLPKAFAALACNFFYQLSYLESTNNSLRMIGSLITELTVECISCEEN